MAVAKEQTYPQPQKKSGVLDSSFKFEETTPVIGREYPTLNLVDDVINAANADELIQDLAITSKSFLCQSLQNALIESQSLNAVLYSSVRSITSQMICKRVLCIV